MFSIIIFIALPLVFLFHDIEEIIMRKRWTSLNADRIGEEFPSMRTMLVHLRDMSDKSFCWIIAEEFLLLGAAVICAIYGPSQAPLFALTWGFCIHLAVHIVQALVIKSYIPGLITSILLLPYAGFAVADMIQQFSWQQNLLYAVSGVIAVAVNLVLMHKVVCSQR